MGNSWHRFEDRLLAVDINAVHRKTTGGALGGWATVFSGSQTSYRYADLFAEIEQRLGIKLATGSFNLRLKQPIDDLPPTPVEIAGLSREWHIAPAKMASGDKVAVAILFRAARGFDPSIAEMVAPTHLRLHLDVEDGDQVAIDIFPGSYFEFP